MRISNAAEALRDADLALDAAKTAAGIVAPHIDTAAQAAALVDSAHYPPLGHRGFATYSRAGRYGQVDPRAHQQRLGAPAEAVPSPVRFPGLDPVRRYTVRPLVLGTPPRTLQDAPPAWFTGDGVTLPGRVLAEVGLPPELLTPEQAQVFTVEAEPA